MASNGLQLSTGTIDYVYPTTPSVINTTPPKTTGTITVRTVETKAGWLGQVRVDDEIVWESIPTHDSKTAEDLARDKVHKTVARLFKED